jgi:thioredoxin reductase
MVFIQDSGFKGRSLTDPQCRSVPVAASQEAESAAPRQRIVGARRPRNWTLARDPFLLETSVPGIFAAGDVRHDVVRRVASAVGQGAVSVHFVHKYLETV